MKKGDTVNIMCEGGFWKGKISKISDHDGVSSHIPIAKVDGLNGISHAVVAESDLKFKDNEYWQFKH